MKIPIYAQDNQKAGELELSDAFSEPVNQDLIKAAVHAAESKLRKPYGASPDAGKRAVAKLSRRRRKYRGSYGIGISRVPRKIMSHSGTRFNWMAAFAPNVVGGRRAHPPKAEKILERKINKKEVRKALRSALAASMHASLVAQNGYRVPKTYPFALDDGIESLTKTKDARKALATLGFETELERASVRTIRPGRGKGRGRPYRNKSSVLIVTSKPGLERATANIPGVQTVSVERLGILHLAPGAKGGRAALFTKAALEKAKAEKLFEVRA